MSRVYFDLETIGLNPFNIHSKVLTHSKILTAQIKINDGKTVVLKEWEIGERKLIIELIDIFKLLPEWVNIFVYNGYFDYGFLFGRLSILFSIGADFRFILGAYDALFSKRKWNDLIQYNNGYMISLIDIARKHGIIYECPFRGRDMQKLYEEKRYDEIVAHGIEDIEAMYYLVEKFGLGDRFIRDRFRRKKSAMKRYLERRKIE